jgi:hypothetical protein
MVKGTSHDASNVKFQVRVLVSPWMNEGWQPLDGAKSVAEPKRGF